MNILNLEGLKAVGQVAPNTIINADCLEAMKYIADKSIDCIICDLPYGWGITSCKWDTVIPFEPLWEQYKRIIKPHGAIALFGSQPFTSALVMSNPKWFKYEWIWEKSIIGNVFNCKNSPLKNIENITVFSSASIANGAKTMMKYYPQDLIEINRAKNNTRERNPNNTIGSRPSRTGGYTQTQTNYPKQILKFPSNYEGIHPTQKPVALIEYLIKTYTLKGELILDNTAGSGTLAIAAINTDRNYICIEKDEHYFEVMRDRIEGHDPNAVKPKPKPKSKSQKETVSDEYVQLSLFGS